MQRKKQRGRPVEADRAAVVQTALRLFEERGFVPVTMTEIARAASISRRTLFRLFPAKADLVWDGLDAILVQAEALLSTLPRRQATVRDLIRQLEEPILSWLDEPSAVSLARRRLRLIAASPELLNHKTLGKLQELLARTLAEGAIESPQLASLTARSFIAVSFGAMLWWAEHGEDMTPLQATRAALASLTAV